MAQKPAFTGDWTERHNGLAQEAGYASWAEWCTAIEAEIGHEICGAIAKSTKAPCRKHPIPGPGRCKSHGGKTPAGPASPSYKHGERSRLFRELPLRLQDAAQAAYGDKELMSLRQQIAVLFAREEDLLSKLEIGDSAAFWAQLRNTVDAAEAAVAREDAETLGQALQAIHQLAYRGGRDHLVWSQYMEVVQNGRMLRETEFNRLKTLQALINITDVNVLMRRLVAIFGKHIKDPAIYRDVIQDIDAEFGAGARALIKSSSEEGG